MESILIKVIYWLLDAPDWQLWLVFCIGTVIIVTLIWSMLRSEPTIYKNYIDSNKLDVIELNHYKQGHNINEREYKTINGH